eukprot:COSAG02_NODE_4259_length_5577_cov_12.639102_2_plen_98_part_00
MRDVFGTDRGGCLAAPEGSSVGQEMCTCADFRSLRDAMTEEQRQAEGAFVACQRASELFLTCTCGHPAYQHTPHSERLVGGAQVQTTAGASAKDPAR